jgi:hypothetical protein
VQHGAEILRRDLAREPKRRGAFAEPLADDTALFGVVVVLRVFLFVVGRGLRGAQRPFGHYQHSSSSKAARRRRDLAQSGSVVTIALDGDLAATIYDCSRLIRRES